MQRASLESAKIAFWRKVEKKESCWIWPSKNRYGAVRFSVGKERSWLVHRFSWLIHRGEIPAGMCVCHTCDVSRCVNPDHLYLGTHAENMRDMKNRKRYKVPSKEDCKKGYGLGLKLHPAPIRRGERQYNAKLTDAQAREIKELVGPKGMTHRAVAKMFGITHKTVWEIYHGLRWAHVDIVRMGDIES